MKKSARLKLIFIIVLIVVLVLLVKSTMKSIDENNTKTNQENGQPNGQGGISTNVTYTAFKEIKETTTIEEGKYSSGKTDENALLVNGKVTANILNIEVTKKGDSNGGDNTSFYGMNSAILAKSGATLNLKNVKIITSATGANGVFSYGGSATTNNAGSDGTVINISDSEITTSKDNSGGIMATGGGIMSAKNLNVVTAGKSSAAIRSDRGGGIVNVEGGTYKTTGQGSPAIYSTADITVKNADLISTSSEGAIIEGKNSITLEEVNLTDTNNTLNGQSTTYKNIFIYQSMSGDAAEGMAKFVANDSKITTNKGDSIYVTNTKASISLKNNKIINKDSTGNFLRIQKDSWGKDGSNGGDVTLNMENQEAVGNIIVDSISVLNMTMNSNSYFEGVINADKTAKNISLKIDKNSKIKLMGDSYITSLEDDDSSYSNIDFNGYKLYVNGSPIN